MQVAISRYNEEVAEGKKPGDTLEENAKGIWSDFLDNIHDPNGQNNIALGTIQGILTTLGGRAIDKYQGKDQSELDQKKAVFDAVNNARIAIKQFSGDFSERDENGVKVQNGQVVKDQEKITSAGLYLMGLQGLIGQKQVALQNKDYVTADFINNKILAGMSYRFMSDPKGVDYLKNMLAIESKASANNPDRVNDVDSNGKEITAQDQLNTNLNNLNMFKRIYDAIDQRHAGFFNLDIDQKDKGEVHRAANFVNKLKASQYENAVNQFLLDKIISKNDANITNLGLENHPSFVNNKTELKDISSPTEERFNDLVKENKSLSTFLDSLKEEYKNLINKKAQKGAFELDKKLEEKVEEKQAQKSEPKQENKQTEVNSVTPAQTVDTNPITTNPTQTSPTVTTQAPTVTAPITTQPTTTPTDLTEQQKDVNKNQKLQDLTKKRADDLAKAQTPEERTAINEKYIKDRVSLVKNVTEKKTPAEQDARFNEIKTLIPNTKSIHVDEYNKLTKLVNDEAKVGNIDDLHESMLNSSLEEKDITGTMLNDEKETEEENTDVPVEEERRTCQ